MEKQPTNKQNFESKRENTQGERFQGKGREAGRESREGEDISKQDVLQGTGKGLQKGPIREEEE